MASNIDITVEDIKKWKEELLGSLPKNQQPPNIEEGTDTHYFFYGPHVYGYVSKEKWNNLMKEEIEKMFK